MSKLALKYWGIGTFAVAGLVLLFLFQRIDVAGLVFGVQHATVKFIVNRSIRFLLNDALALALIYALFRERKYIVFALWVQLVGLIFFLLPYFAIKIAQPGYNGPLVNYLHRIVLNPTLLLLLIPAFYAQRRQSNTLRN